MTLVVPFSLALPQTIYRLIKSRAFSVPVVRTTPSYFASLKNPTCCVPQTDVIARFSFNTRIKVDMMALCSSAFARHKLIIDDSHRRAAIA